MTRINTLPPKVLSKKHLQAEYRELPRIFTAVRKLQDAGKTPADVDIPLVYCLGKGHNKFFYDKCGWLLNRYCDILNELEARKVDFNRDMAGSIIHSVTSIKKRWMGTFQPTPEDHYLNMARIVKRSNMLHVLEELESTD